MYSKKELRYEFALSNGSFDKEGNDKISIDNVKSSFRVGSYGSYGGVQSEIMIFVARRIFLHRLVTILA